MAARLHAVRLDAATTDRIQAVAEALSRHPLAVMFATGDSGKTSAALRLVIARGLVVVEQELAPQTETP